MATFRPKINDFVTVRPPSPSEGANEFGVRYETKYRGEESREREKREKERERGGRTREKKSTLKDEGEKKEEGVITSA